MRPQPPQVLSKVLTLLTAEPGHGLPRVGAVDALLRLVGGWQPVRAMNLIVETAVLVILDEA